MSCRRTSSTLHAWPQVSSTVSPEYGSWDVYVVVAARLAAGVTQSELASRIGTTQSAIARLEGGSITPTVETLSRLADVVGLRFEIAPSSGLTAHDIR